MAEQNGHKIRLNVCLICMSLIWDILSAFNNLQTYNKSSFINEWRFQWEWSHIQACQNLPSWIPNNCSYISLHSDGFKNFQHEAINILALYVLKSISFCYSALQKLTHSIKRMLSLQGITIPNCLHIVDNIHQNKSIDILQLV